MSSMSNVDTPWGLPSDIVVTDGDFSPDMWKPHSPAHCRNSVDTPWGLPPDIVLNQYSRITTQLKAAFFVIRLEWNVTVSERKERRHPSIEHRPIRLPGVGQGVGEEGMESQGMGHPPKKGVHHWPPQQHSRQGESDGLIPTGAATKKW